MPSLTNSHGIKQVLIREEPIIGRNDMAKRFLEIATAAALLLTLALEPAIAQGALTVRVAFVPAMPALAAWVAQDKGFFEAQHLTVSLTPVQNVALIPSTLGKQFEIGTATAVDLIKASAAGLPVAAIGGGSLEEDAHATNAFVVRKDAGINSIKDLHGKNLHTPSAR